MHTEYIVVHRHTFEHLLEHQCRAIAVGTTSVRTLESLYYMGVKALTHPDISEEELHVNQWEPYDLPHDEQGLVIVDGNSVTVEQSIRALLDYLNRDGLEALHSSTQIIIAPGYTYKIVKMLITNSISLRARCCSWSVPSFMATGARSTTMPSAMTSAS